MVEFGDHLNLVLEHFSEGRIAHGNFLHGEFLQRAAILSDVHSAVRALTEDFPLAKLIAFEFKLCVDAKISATPLGLSLLTYVEHWLLVGNAGFDGTLRDLFVESRENGEVGFGQRATYTARRCVEEK